MRAETEAVFKMTETLESANFTPDQSKAVLESIALSMKTFAVTPELLDKCFAEHRREWKQDLKEFKDEMIRQFDDVQELQRSLLRYFLGFTLVMLAGLMGALVTILAS